MDLQTNDLQELNRICKGNQEAIEFLFLWREYVHRIDDIIDEKKDFEFILTTFASAVMLYSHPFYIKNLLALRQQVINITSAYADSVKWENSTIDWQKNFADHYRHVGAEMLIAVASIVGGYENARSIATELRTVCWLGHHNKKGEQI